MDRSRLRKTIVCAALTLAANSHALANDDLFELSLEQLMTLEVTSVSRKAEPLADAPAAIHVITGEQIRNAGITTIPDALRLAPGVHVAQIDANKWAVSARGFNGRFANKLLVLIDGRSVYTPLFSGVFWDIQDTLLEDIDRIEIVRGPGATLWGANAVNGVINIITRSAAATTGGLFAVRHGNQESGYGVARYGGELGDRGHFRVYGKYFERDGNISQLDGPNADNWQSLRAGTRMDWQRAGGDSYTFSAELFDVQGDESVLESSLASPYTVLRQGEQATQGAHALMRWQREHGAGSTSAQLSWSITDRDSSLFGEKRSTIDLELQQQLSVAKRHEVIWGGGYRRSSDELRNSFSIEIGPAKRSANLYSLFLQDRMTLSDRWQLTVGAKFEHNSYTGSELQPNVRLLGALTERSRVWAAVSRAVRVPSRVEHDGFIVPVGGVLPPASPGNPLPLPAAIAVHGSDAVDAEDLTAYELGYRIQASDQLQFDLAAFYNEYDRPGTGVPVGDPYCRPSGTSIAADPTCLAGARYVVIPVELGVGYSARTHGAEVSGDWRPRSGWQLGLAWSWLEEDGAFASTGQRSSARIGHLRSSMEIGERLALHTTMRYVGAVSSIDIGSYLALDARLAWQVNERFELSLSGRSLNDPDHPEFVSEFGDVPQTSIRRSVYLQALWNLGTR